MSSSWSPERVRVKDKRRAKEDGFGTGREENGSGIARGEKAFLGGREERTLLWGRGDGFGNREERVQVENTCM